MTELDARTKLKEVAISLFAERGFDGTTTRDIANTAQLNISLISYYFGGKEGLYKAILEEFALLIKSNMDNFIAEFDKEAIDRDKLRSVIEGVVDRILDLRLNNPYIAQIMIREKLSGMIYSKDIHEKILFEVGEKVADLLRSGQKLGFVRKDLNPHFFMCMLSESIMGYFIMHDCAQNLVQRCYQLPMQRNEFKKQIVSLFTEGIVK